MAKTAIKIRGIEVGRITEAGRYLDKATFLALSTSERIAAYLALVWPQDLGRATIMRVCRLKAPDIAGYGRELLRIGTIRRVSRGRYALEREEAGA